MSLEGLGQNHEKMALYNLTGSGSFENFKDLELQKLSVGFFHNKKGENSDSPILKSKDLEIGEGLCTFINDFEGLVKGDTFSSSQNLAHISSSAMNLTNRGEFQAGTFDFTGKVINEGRFFCDFLNWGGPLFKFGDLSEVILSKRGTFFGKVINTSNATFESAQFFSQSSLIRRN